jgi:hypothetical protein
MRRLKNELDNKSLNNASSNVSNEPLSKNRSASLTECAKISITDKSSVNDVEEWFRCENLNMNIFNHLEPCDGEILKQYFLLKSNAPEYFYRTLEKMVDLRSALLFSSKLSKLFI